VTLAGENARIRASTVLFGIFALAALAVFVSLGTWQLERKAWKEALIATLRQRLAADPDLLPPSARWGGLDPAEHEFRRVHIPATFARQDEALVYSTGSAFRPDVSGQGYWVFAPAELADGRTVIVNRGFVPEGQRSAETHLPLQGRMSMIGALRWPEPRSWFAAKDDPAHNLFFVRDPRAIAAAKGWGDVAPFYVELETPSGEGSLPRYGRLSVALRNEHLQYALTWYGLAAVLAVAFAFWIRGRRHEAGG
jgi:cytochrome oxidase assembly protein ShyY1